MDANNQNDKIESYKSVEPLTIFLVNQDLEMPVPWNLIESNEKHTIIQIYFEDANSFSPLAVEQLSIKVTFWGATELHWKVYR